MTRWLKRLLLALLGLVVVLAAVLVGGGMLLPHTFQIQRSVLVNTPADTPYALVVEPRRWRAWSAWNQRDPAMTISYFGPAQGSGAGWAWHSKTEGDGKMTLTAAEPGKRVGYDLYFPDFDSTSTGEFLFAPQGSATRVTWVMVADTGRNPVWRWMGLMMDSMAGPDFESGLARLKQQSEAGG